MSTYWPGQLDYFEAVQMPAISFADADLQTASVLEDSSGIPQVCAGNFSNVYKFIAPDAQRSWAVKCFTRPVERPNVRYAEISRSLAEAGLHITIEFVYLEQGIQVHGEWYPIVKMEWIEGRSLRQFILDHLNQPKLLKRMFEHWPKMESLTRRVPLAHGDIQHGNLLLVTHGRDDVVEPKLIDYDGMWTPALAKFPPAESGHSDYQHPRRARDHVYSLEIDRFPHLVIACALKCLSEPQGPELWERYDNGDNLLFRKEDFSDPASSPLLRELWESGNNQLQACAAHVALAARGPLEETPLLAGIVDGDRMLPPPPERFVQARELFSPTLPPAQSMAWKMGAGMRAVLNRPWIVRILAGLSAAVVTMLILVARSMNSQELTFEVTESRTWKGAQTPVEIPVDGNGFCMLTAVGGDFRPAGSFVELHRSETGKWELDGGGDVHASATVVHTSRKCPVEEHVWKGGRAPHRLIQERQGFVVLSGVTGSYQGWGEEGFLRLDSEGAWWLDGTSNRDSMRVKAITVRTSEPMFSETFLANQVGEPTRLIHSDDGFCFISGFSGKWTGRRDDAKLEIRNDGYWYLTLRQANRLAWVTATAIAPKPWTHNWQELTRQLNEFSEWAPGEGWQAKSGGFHGAGKSELRFEHFLPQDLKLRFRLKVLKGLHPKVHLRGCGTLWFGSDDSSHTLRAEGGGLNRDVEGTPHPYQIGAPITIEIRLFRDTSEFRVNGKLIDVHERRWPSSFELVLNAGDGASSGECIFSDFVAGPP